MASTGARVPRLIAGVDLTKLPLSPLEGFVLSRVDGSANVSVLADLTSLDEDEVARILDRLIEVGAVEWARESVSLPRATGRATGRTPAAPLTVPESLRSPPAPIDAARPLRAAGRTSEAPHPAETVYKAKLAGEDRVDPNKRSVFPPAAPRASHTGARRPPGEVEELDAVALGTADTLLPPSPEPLGFEEPAASSPPPRARESAPPPRSPSPVAPPRSASVPPASAPPAPDGAEELDIDAERRKRIDDLYVALDLLDHYQVLGVSRGADRSEIRNAYFSLSKVFHPDTMFRKRLGPYKAKMEAIFKRLTEAYEVLGKKRSREEYDRYLDLTDRTRRLEEALDPDPAADAQRELGRAAAQLEAELAGAPSRPAAAEAPPSPREPAAGAEAPPRAMSEEAKARARELMAKKLRGALRASEAHRRRTSEAPREPPAPTTGPDKRQVLKSLASSLKHSASHTGGLDPVHRHLLTAKRAERDGDLGEAARALRLALALAPERQDVRAEHARVSRLLANSLSSSYEEQALYEQRHGKWSAAALSWAKVFEGRPDDARAARLAAEALVEARGDLHRAKELAQRAVELAPDDATNLRALGRVYMAAGLALNARRVLQRAAALDPGDEMVENLLRDLDR